MNYLNWIFYRVKNIFGSPPNPHIQDNDAVSRKRPRDDADDDLIMLTDSPPKRTRMLDNVLREADMNLRNVNTSSSGTQTYGNSLHPSRPKLLGSEKTVDSWTTVIADEDETMSPSKFKNRYKAPMHVRSPNKRSRTSQPTLSKRNGSVTNLTSPASGRLNTRTTMIASKGIFDAHRRSPRSQVFKPANFSGMSRDEYQTLLCSVLCDSSKVVMRKPSALHSNETIDLTKDETLDASAVQRRFSKVRGMTTPTARHDGKVDSTPIDLTTPPMRKPSELGAPKSSSTPVVHPSFLSVDDELFDRENVPRRVVPRMNSFGEQIKDNEFTDPNLVTIRTARYERFLQKSKELEKKYNEKRQMIERENSLTAIYDVLSSRLHSHLKITEAILIEEEEEVETLKPELTKEMMAKINHAWNERMSPREVLISKFKLDVTRADLMTLKNLNWLNDAVINYYMELIAERGGTAKEYPQVYTFSTFFYPTLGKGGYDRVRRYTRKVDLFSKDLILVPIHLAVHWCMAKIDLKKKKIYYYDSMRASNQRVLEMLLDYLVQEHRDKKKEKFDTEGWELINDKDIPCQKNGSDCGVFACTFGEYSSRKSKFNFSQDDMPYMRQKMVYEILSGRLLL